MSSRRAWAATQLGAIAAAAVLAGCGAAGPGQSGTSPSTTSEAGPAGHLPADDASTTDAPDSEEFTDRPVAVDEDGERASLPPVPPGDTAEAGDAGEVEVQVTDVDFVTGVAHLPGEVTGPAMKVSLEVANDSDEPLHTGGAVVNAYVGSDRRPASTFREPGALPMPAVVGPGESATGIYLFAVPEADRATVVLEIDLAPELEVLHFEGDFSTW